MFSIPGSKLVWRHHQYRLVTIVVTGVFFGWLLYLDIFGIRRLFQANFELVRILFIGALFCGLVLEILRFVGEWSKGTATTNGSSIVELLLSVGRIVEHRSVVFAESHRRLTDRQPSENLLNLSFKSILF